MTDLEATTPMMFVDNGIVGFESAGALPKSEAGQTRHAAYLTRLASEHPEIFDGEEN